MEIITKITEWYANNETIVSIITAGVTFATVITASTKTKWDNKALNAISYVLNLIAGNVAKNKNKDDQAN